MQEWIKKIMGKSSVLLEYKKVSRVFGLLLMFITSFSGSSCIDPVTPEFELREGLVVVEGFVSTAIDASYVSISRSEIQFGVYKAAFVEGAQVSFENTDTNEIVVLQEETDVYVPPSGFVARPGESWQLNIVLSDGSRYGSTPEKVLTPVDIIDINATYSPELIFRDASEKFVPGHSVSVSFNDVDNQDNYYYWTFRSYENLTYCQKCEKGIYRNGNCESPPAGTSIKDYYDYVCERNCWRIRFAEDINVFSDEFTKKHNDRKFTRGERFVVYEREYRRRTTAV